MGFLDLFDPMKRMRKAKTRLTAEGRELSQTFRGLGDVKNMPKADIVAVVGAPSSFTAMQGGHLATWQRTGFQIQLAFDAENRCQGVKQFWMA